MGQFVLKIASVGNFSLVKSIGQSITDFYADTQGNFYFTAKAKGFVDFNPGPAYNLQYSSMSGAYIVKCNKNLNFIGSYKCAEGGSINNLKLNLKAFPVVKIRFGSVCPT